MGLKTSFFGFIDAILWVQKDVILWIKDVILRFYRCDFMAPRLLDCSGTKKFSNRVNYSHHIAGLLISYCFPRAVIFGYKDVLRRSKDVILDI